MGVLNKEPKQLQALHETCVNKIHEEAADAWRQKLGFKTKGHPMAATLWDELGPMMRRGEVDYIIFFRQLAVVAEIPGAAEENKAKLFEPLARAFYREPDAAAKEKWASWLVEWSRAL